MANTKQILLAEDEEHVARLIEFKLTRDGWSVHWVKNGKEAISKFGERDWSLIILDVMMPECNGWQALENLKASQWSKIPVLMLTAKSLPQDIANAAELGANSFLKKPFDPEELSQCARKLVEK